MKHRSGVVIADISDHLPIIINSLSIKNLQINSFRSHKRNMLHKDKFIDELKNTDWDFITNCTDVNSSYNTFIDFFLKSLDKHCPYESKLIQIKHNKKPWLSKSLITACKKKNFLYKCFLSKKTVKAESKYKLYKNMLTTILRRAEKTYYDEFLSQNKSNIKKPWGTLNFIINKNFESAVPLSEFNFDNKIYKEKKAVANGFNNFFVNVGPKLAKDIEETEGSIFDTMNNPLKGSFFLEPVTIHEVLKIVNASSNKTSMDHSGINFALLKEYIYFIVKPVCHIANFPRTYENS